MYRAFLDANVLFSAACVEQSGLRRIWKLGDVELVTSGYAIEEARRNLVRAEHVADLQKLIGTVSIIDIRAEGPSLHREPHGLPEKDQPILWAAIDCGASHLITGDVRHFGHLLDTVVEGVHVVRPSVFMKLWEAREHSRGHEARRVAGGDLSIHGEARYIVKRAQAGEGAIVSIGSLIFFSTETGDAWVLDREDRLALCLARDGAEQPFQIVETESRFGITWAGTFELVGDAFVYADKSGRVRTVLGYPVEEIRRAL